MDIKERWANIRGVVTVLIIFTIFLIIKFMDYFLVNAVKNRLGINFLYLYPCLAILFMITRFRGSEGLGYSAVKADGLLYSIIFYLPFYSAGTLAEMIAGMAGGARSGFLFFPQNFRINFIGNTSPLVSRVILIFIYYVLVVVLEESFFRGIMHSTFLKIMKPMASYISIGILFSVWQLIKPLRGYTLDPMHTDIYVREAVVTFLLYFVLSIKWDLLKEGTGSLWFSTGDHFLSVFLFNIFHVTQDGVMDQDLFIRYIFISVVPLILLFMIRNKGIHSGILKKAFPQWAVKKIAE